MNHIISHQGTANQNHHEIPHYTHQHGWNKNDIITSVENAEKLELPYTAGGNEK